MICSSHLVWYIYMYRKQPHTESPKNVYHCILNEWNENDLWKKGKKHHGLFLEAPFFWKASLWKHQTLKDLWTTAPAYQLTMLSLALLQPVKWASFCSHSVPLLWVNYYFPFIPKLSSSIAYPGNTCSDLTNCDKLILQNDDGLLFLLCIIA